MSEYRWNTLSAVEAYDAAAEYIHPHYLDLQDHILGVLADRPTPPEVVVDAGGGSGRLVERILEQFPETQGYVLDQSEPYLEYAANRLAKFNGRGHVVRCQLQDDWTSHLPVPVDAIVSMSAIHHLESEEKHALYARCYDYLAPDGQFINGDEIRLTPDETFRDELEHWHRHMRGNLENGSIPEQFGEMVDKWQRRNLIEFGQPKQSGDDCQDTVETQLDFLHSAGFAHVQVPWQQRLWALLVAKK